MKISDALIVAETTMTMGEAFINKLKNYRGEFITKEALENISELPDLEEFSTKTQEENN